MANDVLASPEILVVKGVVFWLSPLSEYRKACLGAWIRWSSDGRCNGKLSNSESLEQLESVAGSIQILYWSTRDTSNKTVEELAEFIGDDAESAKDIINFFSELLKPPANMLAGDLSTSGQPATEDEIYASLAQVYHLTLEQIGQMTDVQQTILIRQAANVRQDGNLQFATEDDYLRWKATKP